MPAITLKFFGGMTTEGIATALGIPSRRSVASCDLGKPGYAERSRPPPYGIPAPTLIAGRSLEHIFIPRSSFAVDRAAYLARACGDDAELRSEVASLLENDRDDTATIHRAVDGDLKRLAETADRGEIGERVGPYRWFANWTPGEWGSFISLFGRTTTIFRSSRSKWCAKAWSRLRCSSAFEPSAKILAMLTHPNIGAILDA